MSIKYPRVIAQTQGQRLVQTGPEQFDLEQPSRDGMEKPYWEFERHIGPCESGDYPEWVVRWLCARLAGKCKTGRKRRARRKS